MVSSGLIDRVDVSHYRLSIHLLIAFIILSLILWNYFKLKNIKISDNKIGLIFPSIFLILIFMPNNNWCFCFRYGCWNYI